MAIKFAFSERKAVQALAYIASVNPGLTPLYVSKVMFFAEKWHLNRYGRPIVADTYIAMPRGPVPSTIKDYIDEKWNWVDKPDDMDAVIVFDRSKRLVRLMSGTQKPNLSVLSETDIECLAEAVEFCRGKSPDELSRVTHLDKAWRDAPLNGPMSYDDFIDDDLPNRAEILELAEENAACGVL